MSKSTAQPVTTKSVWQQRDSLALAAVVAVAVGLRLYRLGAQGLWLDEAWSWSVSQLPVGDLLRMSLTDRLPPLYFLALKGWLLAVPASEVGMRLFSVVWSVAALLLAMIFVHRRWGARAALYAGWFMAVSSFDVYFAQETRMYTLLGFCWLLSFVCLADGIGGRPRLFIIWGVVNAGAIWVQYAALPMVAVSWVLAVTLWGFLRQDGSGRRSGTVWLWTGLGISVAAAAPALALSLRFIEAGGGGTWLPTPQDLLALFALVTSGLSSARGHFLDSAHLTIPALAGLPDLAWAAAGLLPASLAVHGLASAWQKGGRDRADALLATALVLGPVAGTYGLAVVSGASIWAQKAFLGAAYLIYLWAGVGLSRAPWRAARYAMAVAALAISLASLIPYYTVWQKTDTRIAFGTIPAGSPQPAILLDRAYMGPVAFYYLGAGAEVWGINGTSKGAILVRLTPNGVLPQSYVPVECDAGQFHAAPTVYLYPTAVGRALDERQTWPACVRTKPTVLFREGKWTPLDR